MDARRTHRPRPGHGSPRPRRQGRRDRAAGRGSRRAPGSRAAPARPRGAGRQLAAPVDGRTVIPQGQRCSQVLRAFLTREIGPAFHFDAAMRDYIAQGAGRTLADAVAHWHATRADAARPRRIGDQFEFNGFLRDWHARHPGSPRAEALDAWRAHRSRPRTRPSILAAVNSEDAADHVLSHRQGRTGVITLNRPRALNALTHPMVLRMEEVLRAWADDPEVEQVLLRGAGERGLCAGGDIRAIHDDAKAGTSASAAFWRDEYRLNALIARYPKPYVALMDGITMGGGVGVSAHGSVRVVTERSRVAMPETGIGFVPDVGGTWLLSRAPGRLGTHLALTGSAVGAADALLCGLADHHVPAERLPDLAAALAEAPAREAVARFATEPAPGVLAARRHWIDRCHAADTVEETVDRLLAEDDPAAKEAAETILAKSPTALKVTLAAMRRSAALTSLEEALDQEYRVSCNALRSPDLVEGIRAQVVDKDRSPRWNPTALADVSDADVARFFHPPADGAAAGQR
ncbi:3-hydroxyisobutyryl-CoA hydrolase [Streptomyces globosus]|uniref:3-hydroxyisobutyryl-CoA hydrolase n=1 Tax=Streptomyces globosus TaxID=68209 RepID=UPI00363502FD